MQQISNPYSDLKILCHPDKMRDLLERRRTAPLYVRIKPTNICNQNCWYCVYANDKVIENRHLDRRESIAWPKMQEIIYDLAEMGTKAITFSGGGEPLCYPYIRETLELVKANNIDYAMITNGQALDKSARKALREASWVRISLDSSDDEMYRRIRKVDTFGRVLDNISAFAKDKAKDCVLGVNYVVTKDNYQEIYNTCKLLSGIGIDNIKFSPLMVKGAIPEYHREIRYIVMEQLEKARKELQTERFSIIDKYSEDESLTSNYQKPYRCCYIKEIFTVIGADCKVYYCHQRAYTEDGIVGDLTGRSFKELWFSEETSRKFEDMDASVQCNFRCAFDERNQLLDTLINMDKRHINFI